MPRDTPANPVSAQASSPRPVIRCPGAHLIGLEFLSLDALVAAGAVVDSAEKATCMAGEAIQTLGDHGSINDYPAGSLWRDAKLYEIGAGTGEFRPKPIDRELFGETTRNNPFPC